jgi:hypothetical protein
MPSLQHETRSIPVSSLLLDRENARHGIKPDQEAVLEWMATEQDRSHLIGLAQSIADIGLSPTERFLVVFAPDDQSLYVVMEGNRRLSALKMLADPDKCPDEIMTRRLRKMLQEATVPPATSVDCVILPNEDAAATWIELKHTGPHGGAGVLTWGAQEKEAFRERFKRRKQYGPSSELLDYAEDHGLLTADERKRVSISSLQRLLGTRDVRQQIGLEVSDGHISVVGDPSHVDSAVSDVLRELAAGVSVSDIKSVGQRREWVRQLGERKGWAPPAPATPITLFPAAATPSTPAGQGPTPNPVTALPGRRAPRDPLQRRTVIRAGTGLRANNPKLKGVWLELRALEVDEFPIAGAILLRVFIELCLDAYLQAHSLTPKDQLFRKANQVRDHVLRQNPQDVQKVKEDFKGLEVFANDPNNIGSANTLNAVVHSLCFQLGPNDIKRGWDQLEPCIRRIEPSL